MPRICTLTNAMLCTVLASHVHTLTLTWGHTYPPLGHTSSILANTSNARDAYNALGFISPYILHCHLQISDLLIDIIFGTSSLILH